MFESTVTEYSKTRQTIGEFLGYNHNLRISSGEWYDMENLTSDYYPVMSPREKRKYIFSLSSTDWVGLETTFTKTIDSSASYTYGYITSDVIECSGLDIFKIEYTAASGVFNTITTKAMYYTGEMLVSSEEGLEEYQVPKSCDGIVLQIIVTPENAITFTVDNLENITDIVIYEYDKHIRGMILKDDELAYMVRQTLYYNDVGYDFSDYIEDDDGISEQQLVSYGAYILIFPLGLYLNVNTLEYGYLGSKFVAGYTESLVEYSMCSLDGAEYTPTVSDTEPEDPQEGDYWYDTANEGLYQYSAALDYWNPVATSYIKISMTSTSDFPNMFSEGDALYMDSIIEDINSGSIIKGMGDILDEDGNKTGGYIVVSGLIDTAQTQSVSASNLMTFERRIPILDYVTVSNNRVWGCHYGYDEENGYLNEIYASKLGDATNWYVYAGVSTDSYALSLGDDGIFTGAITYNGYPMFFKENIAYMIYGAYPAAYQLNTYDIRGVQEGSEKSLCVVDEYLMWKSDNDIVAFTGSQPESIYSFFGTESYHDAVAGTALGKYYISMLDANEDSHLFVYDTRKGLWHKEDDLKIDEFIFNRKGELYGRTGIMVYGFGNASTVFGQTEEGTEAEVNWSAETGDLVFGYMDKVYMSRISVRASIDTHTYINVYIQYDDNGNWKKVSTLTGEGHVKTYLLPITNERRDSVKLRFEGKDGVKLYAITYLIDEGSDEE